MLIIVIVGAIGFYWINDENNKGSASLDARSDVMSRLIAETVATPMWNLDIKLVQKIVDAAMADLEISEIEVYSSNGGNPIASAVREGNAVGPIESIASITEENNAAVEEVSASSEEMSAQVQEVSSSAQVLAQMAPRSMNMYSNSSSRPRR